MMSLMNIMQYVLERNEFDTLAGNLQGESSRGVEGRREVGRDGERWGWDVAVRSEVGGAEGHGLRDRLHAVEHGLWAGVGSWLAVWVLRERVCGFGLAWGGGAFLDRVGWERRCERLGGEMVVGDRVWVNGVAARESVKSGFFRFVAWMPLGVMFEAVFCRGRACWGRVLVRIDGVVGGNNLQRQVGGGEMGSGWGGREFVLVLVGFVGGAEGRLCCDGEWVALVGVVAAGGWQIIRVNSFTMNMEILLEPTSNKLMVEHAEFDESNANVLERFYTLAGNPVKEILLKLNLPDHRKLKDGGEVQKSQDHKMSKSQDGKTRLCLVDDLTVLKITSPLTSKDKGRTPTLSFMRPFGCPVTILNTIDHLGKFDGKADEGFFVGYSLNSKAFRVFNSRTRIVEENLHIRFSESTPNVVGSGPDWLFDIDALTRTMNYEPIVAGTQSNGFAGTKASDNAGQARKETEPVKDYILLPLWTADPPYSQDPKSSHDDGSKPSSDDGKKVDEDPRKDSECKDQEKEDNVNSTNNVNTAGNVNTVSSTVNVAGTNEVNAVGGKISIELLFDPNMPALEDYSIFDFSRDDEDDGAVADMNNLDTTIQVSPNPTTRIHKDHPLDQVIGDLQSATQTRKMSKNLEEHGFEEPKMVIHALKDPSWIEAMQEELLQFKLQEIEEEVYVYQPPGFEDPYFPDRVYKVEKALYKGDILLMSSMGELTFFLGLQVKQKKNGIFISQDKYVAKILKKFGFTEVKTASTPMLTQKPLLKDENGKEVDVHMYRSMIGSLMYLTSSRPDIMFLVYPCARYQVNPKVSHLHAVKRIFRSAIPTNPHHPPTFIQPSILPQKTQQPRKPKRKDTQVPQPSNPIENVADEAVHKELGDSLVRAATTASSLEAEQDSGNINKTQSKATPNESSSLGTNSGGGPWCQEIMGDTITQTRFESVSKHSNDSLLARGNTLQSDEDRLKLDELMALCTTLQNQVLDLEKTKTTQHNEIASLKRRVKKLEKKDRSRTHRLKRLYKVSLTARVESSDTEESLGEDASKQGMIDAIDANEEITLVSVHDVNVSTGEEVFSITVDDITLAQVLKEIKSTKPKKKEVVIQELGESTKTISSQLSSQQSQDKGKGILIEPMKPMNKKDLIRLDEESALNLHAEFDEEERLTKEKAKKEEEANIALIETWDDI
ncbi:ribonuclease H-like domain-containing protein [Tanacetum coccineum]|uniref:Ribonuclease H-like domain-containing protein n=1 Tax=Tanacetum coccineum TaxID=301880 RepID=A0ABQ5H9C2_9ASTR